MLSFLSILSIRREISSKTKRHAQAVLLDLPPLHLSLSLSTRIFREDSYLRDPFSNVTADVHKYVAGSVRIEIRGCARFAAPPSDARTRIGGANGKMDARRTNRSKERVSRMIWRASSGKTVGNFARRGEGNRVQS